MSTGQPQASVPDTLKLVAGITWRLLVVVAGLYVAGRVLDSIFPVVFALFFAMLMTAWAQPIMNLLHKKLPKILSMILALLIIGALVFVIVGSVVRSTISEGPKLVASIQSGITQIEDWLQNGPLQMSDANLNNLLSQIQDTAKGAAGGLLHDALGVLHYPPAHITLVDRLSFLRVFLQMGNAREPKRQFRIVEMLLALEVDLEVFPFDGVQFIL